MLVFEIIVPGTWLDCDDRGRALKIESQLQHLESQFFEANTALNLFANSRAVRPSFADRGNWERDSQRRSEISRAIEQEQRERRSGEHWDVLQLETEIRFKREKWSNGGVPREFEHNLPFIYARAFLYALDAFDKFLGVLAKEEGVSEEVAEIYGRMALEFPHLRGVRNTAQHLEDRSRGLGAGRNPKPIDLKPIANNMFNGPGGMLILNALNGSKYGSTMSDGHYGEIDVSPESMQRLQKIFEEVLQTFKWHGPKRHAPSA